LRVIRRYQSRAPTLLSGMRRPAAPFPDATDPDASRADPLDTDEFRAALGTFATGVTVVATTTPDGEHHATTANSFTSVSLDPMLVLVCLGAGGRGLEAIRAAEVFSVNVLAEPQEDLSRRFADRHRPPGTAGFAGTRFALDRLGCPRLGDSLATFSCRVHTVHPAGDHAIVVGEVAGLTVAPGAEPLVFHGGRYRALAPEAGIADRWAS
jgi:flavin reductase (DIM6/NTAB) family NADH-FMN oxidoreductase RutF